MESMDELELLARALPDARPPSDEVVARGRAKAAAARTRPRPGRLTSRGSLARRNWVPRNWAPRNWARRSWAWAAVATAAVVAVVVALAANLAPAPAPVLTPAPSPKPGPNQAMLDLAARIEKLHEPPRRYWRTSRTADDKTRTENWLPRSAGDQVMLWRVAGGKCVWGFSGDWGGRYGDRSVADFTMADLAALPAETGALERKFREYNRIWNERGFRESFAEFAPVLGNMLYMPISPQVRAGVLRVLAGQPGTRAHGVARDPLGREGLVVDLGGEGGTFNDVPVKYRLFISLHNGAWQANVAYAVKGGRIVSYDATLVSGWTDLPPRMPKGCPRKG
ncbi:hypothetical protein ACIBHY_23365 [Nonomuraea sp. NPDC050547]|uniref:hypothetical protein n=1 Tax=Nonomuraea sp. NPDC050547 TaxID=3364368 RepID=UPI00379855FE